MKKFTWGDLKKFVNSLPEQELPKVVRWWGEERGGLINFAERTADDYIDAGEGFEEKSAYDNDDTFTKEEIAEMIVLEKGTPILHTDFHDTEPPLPF